MLRHRRADGAQSQEGGFEHGAQLKRVRGQGPRARGRVEGDRSGDYLSSVRTLLRFDLPSVHAIRAVLTALQGVEGIVRADVSRGEATIEHDGRATAQQLREAVASAGFEVDEIVEERRRLAVREE